MTSNNKFFGYIPLLLSFSILIFLACWFNFTQDDAFISFRYAANMIDGNGLVFNIGERIEGYTNFLWTIILSLGYWLGLSLPIFSKILGVLFGFLTLAATYYAARMLFDNQSFWSGAVVLLVSCMPSFSYWMISGMETPLFAFLLVVSLISYYKRSVYMGLFLAMATLTRPEGIIIFGIFIIFDLINKRKIDPKITRSIMIYLLIMIPYILFKYFYYGSILPNTFYAKVGFTFDRLSDGIEYLSRYGWHYLGAGAFLIPGFIALRKHDTMHLVNVLLVVVVSAYIVFVGGDVLKVHRFFVPLMPIMALVIIYGIKEIKIKRYIQSALILIIIAWQIIVPAQFISTYHLAEKALVNRMEEWGQNLLANDNTDFTVAASTIGALSYTLKGHDVIDMLGLTDSTIARHPESNIKEIETTWKERRFNIPYLLSRQPDYILFSTGSKPSAPAEKALHLYSDFLSNYRTVPFEIFGNRSDIFKRYGEINSDINRDINSQFVVYFMRGMNRKINGQLPDAIEDFNKALSFIPENQYTLARYYIAECLRLMKRHPESYRLLVDLSARDSLTYEVYKDLYTYEYLAYKNMEKAEFYRSRLNQLIPWYMETLDSQIRRWKK